jgi:hypothetical protein
VVCQLCVTVSRMHGARPSFFQAPSIGTTGSLSRGRDPDEKTLPQSRKSASLVVKVLPVAIANSELASGRRFAPDDA